MRYLVEFKAPDGRKVAQEFDADSHWGAAQEASFDADVLESLLATGKTKFGARVRRCSDNVTRSVLVEIEQPEAPPPLVVAPARRNEAEVTIPDGIGLGLCNDCGRERVPAGYTITVPEGAVLCRGCSLPLPQVSATMEGFEEAEEEPGAVVEEEPEEEPEEAGPKFCAYCGRPREGQPTKIEKGYSYCKGCLWPTDDPPDGFDEWKRCECCTRLARHSDIDGVPLCDTCWEELREEEDKVVAEEGDPGDRFYLIVFGDHLEPGHDDRVAIRVKADDPRVALTSAEYVVEGMTDKGVEWLKAYYQVGLTPTISVCDSPVEAAKEEAAEPEIEGALGLYEVNIFLGTQALTVEAEARSPEEACAVAVTDNVQTIHPHLNGLPTVAVSAKSKEDETYCWGPGVVRVPVELVVSWEGMGVGEREGAARAMGIERWDAAPPFDLGNPGQ